MCLVCYDQLRLGSEISKYVCGQWSTRDNDEEYYVVTITSNMRKQMLENNPETHALGNQIDGQSFCKTQILYLPLLYLILLQHFQ